MVSTFLVELKIKAKAFTQAPQELGAKGAVYFNWPRELILKRALLYAKEGEAWSGAAINEVKLSAHLKVAHQPTLRLALIEERRGLHATLLA